MLGAGPRMIGVGFFEIFLGLFFSIYSSFLASWTLAVVTRSSNWPNCPHPTVVGMLKFAFSLLYLRTFYFPSAIPRQSEAG